MNNSFGESDQNREWENFINFPTDGTDILATDFDDPNLFPPLDFLLESTTPHVNAEHARLGQQSNSRVESSSSAAGRQNTWPRDSDDHQDLELQVKALASKIQEVKSL